MTSSFPVTNLDQKQAVANGPSLERRLFVILGLVALLYAFCAGLRTVQDFDLGWQMATARWVLQHHQVPKVDVLSYTMQGQPWTYPVGSGIIFYLAYKLGGFALISWIGAAACVGTISLLLRRGSAATAAIAILAVPLIAARTTPRADMFTIVLFAAFLSLLWENYQTGKARLWLLPLLMIAWVNLHFGFASGLALVGAYVAAELLETVFGAERRRVALLKLRRAWPWFAATAAATLVNPWGWRVYHALLVQQRANAQQQLWIDEWAPIPVTWATVSRSLLLREPGGAIYLLLAIAMVAGGIALFRGHWAAAILLLGATYPATQAIRMGAVFACVVVIVGGAELATVLAPSDQHPRSKTLRWAVAGVLATCFVLLAGVRCFDLVTNRHYHSIADEAVFGAGLCSWFPQRAVEFIERQNLPGEILNTYAAGGYLSFALGSDRRVYIDGRDTLYGPPHLARNSELDSTSPDSATWQEEASRYGINTFILSVARYDGLPPSLLLDLCNSKTWRPVYLDENSAVFVRNLPQNEPWIQRLAIQCATAPLPAPRANKRGEDFNQWANTAITLAELGRNSEAVAAYQKAFSIFPDAAFLHAYYADLLFAMGRLDDSEQQYLKAVALQPSESTWGALARTYLKRGRMLAGVEAMEHRVQFARRPYLTWQDLGYLYLQLQQPENALRAFNQAARTMPRALKTADNGFFAFKVAQGRSAAWSALGDRERATAYQEQAANLEPNVPQPWRRLAQMYDEQGRTADAARARAHAAQAEQRQVRH